MNWFQKILSWFGLYKSPVKAIDPGPIVVVPGGVTKGGLVEVYPPNGQWGSAYDDIIKSKLTPAMFEYRNFYFFPNGASLDATWWCRLLQSIAYVESNYDNNNVYTESFIDDSTGEKCQSVGLFQLSVGDAISYLTCPTVRTLNKSNLHDPVTNIKAACEIIDHLISNGKPLSSYWSSTDPKKSGPQTLAKLKDLLK